MFLKTKSVVGKITNSLTPKQQTVVKEKQTVMAVQFYLFPRALKSGERPISMSAHIANTRIQTTIGISVNPDYWFDAKQKVKKGAVNSKGMKFNEINDKLDAISKAFNTFENANYVDYLKFVAESNTNGYFATEEASDYGIKVVSDDYASRFAYQENNYIVVLDTPRVYTTDGFDAMFAVTKYTASASRSMEIIEDLITDSELCNILLYGVEGSDYYFNEDGTVTRISDTYKMSNQHVGNVFMTYPCTNDGMFAEGDYVIRYLYEVVCDDYLSDTLLIDTCRFHPLTFVLTGACNLDCVDSL